MAVSPTGASRAPAPCSWPRRWAEQEPLLERQHGRLEALLSALIEQHRQPLAAELLETSELGEQLACRRLLWDLRLHLRLEERWLAAADVLCPGHRASHQDAARQGLADFCGCGAAGAGSRQARLTWLQLLQAWFSAHREGPDAMAYGQARRVSGG